jgi:exopolysaccharide production protein ExoY
MSENSERHVKIPKSHERVPNNLHFLPRAQPEVSKLGLPDVFYSRIYRKVGKRSLDILLVLVSLPMILPMILLIAVLVLLGDSKTPSFKPIFFGHWRVGRNGRKFRCWKIRSMVPDADKYLQLHLESDPSARAEWNKNFKLENDPRITSLGSVLRRSSLDELPQLWNILTGEMSLVGPRPVTEAELRRYECYVVEYKMMRPGLTGLWQVSGRNDTTYDERVMMDVDYARRCSLYLDVSILMRTVLEVARRTGK